MMKIIGISLLLCALVGLSRTQATVDSEEYTAAVVEYMRSNKASSTERFKENLDQYLGFIKEASEKHSADIIVFPEATLYDGSKDRKEVIEHLSEDVPDPKTKPVPCENGGGEALKGFSCAAKIYNIYVVINLSEKKICNKESQESDKDDRLCAPDGLNLYNTDVVFDRNGAIIARYRKFNLFGQKGVFNTTKTAQRVTFETDFGVRFGLFTCFDIMFNEPTLGLLRDGVKDFVFPTMWFSELPFLTALQIQEYWAYTNDVNLLASGASNTAAGSGGSGIYAGIQGPLASFMSKPVEEKTKADGEPKPDPKPENNRLIVAKVPKLKSLAPKLKLLDNPFKKAELASQDATSMEKFFMKRDDAIDKFTSEVIKGAFAKELCSGEICCTFNVTSQFLNKTEGKDRYEYRAIVGDVIRSFSGVKNGGVKACAIVACSGPELKHCAVRFNHTEKVEAYQIFNSIRIEGDFPAIDEVLTLPTTLSHSMRPLKAGSFNYNEAKTGDKKHVRINLRGLPVKDLQTFGIFGRDFRFDSDSSTTIKSSFTILFTMISYFAMKFIFNA